MPKTDVAEVPNERSRRPRVRQRVADKPPLDRYSGRHEEGLPQQGQRGLSSRQASVEQANSGDNWPDDGSTCLYT